MLYTSIIEIIVLSQCYQYYKLRKAFSKFYHRQFELNVVKYRVDLTGHITVSFLW